MAAAAKRQNVYENAMCGCFKPCLGIHSSRNAGWCSGGKAGESQKAKSEPASHAMKTDMSREEPGR